MLDLEKNETFENPAQTMRDTMREIGLTELIDSPTDKGDLLSPWVVTIPTGRTIENLTQQRLEAAQLFKPLRRKGTARLKDLDSLIAWANRFKGDSSVLFSDPDQSNPTLQCIANYHGAGPSNSDGSSGDSTAEHCDHRAVYDFPLSKEWRKWMGASGSPMDKDEMGEFLEANAKDIQDPTPNILGLRHDDANIENWEKRLINTARQIEGRYGQLSQLLALSRHFQVYESTNLEVSSNRDTGEQSIQFTNEHKDKDGAPIKIPNLIIITIPVFEGGAAYRMPVRFRYRKKGSSLAFILTAYNPQAAFDDALSGAVQTAAEATGLEVFMGQPER